MAPVLELTKYIQKAFDFHPFGFEKPQMYDQWVMGPVFIVKLPDDPERMAFDFLAGVYMQDPSWQIKFTKLIGEAKNATQQITLSKSKHESSPKCTYRMFGDEPQATYPLELAYPLVMLAKKLGISSWRTTPGATNVMVFGYNDADELLGVFAARRVTEDHVES